MGIWLLPGPWWTRTLVFGSAIIVTLYMVLLKRIEMKRAENA